MSKTALITGANKGIGLELARQLVRDQHAPLGAHGIAEIGITGVAAAIANAAFNATGKRVRELPIILDKLLKVRQGLRACPHFWTPQAQKRCRSPQFKTPSKGTYMQIFITGATGFIGSAIIGAGNRAQDTAIVKPMSSALLNRMVHVHLQALHRDWLVRAGQNEVHPLVVECIQMCPDHLWSAPPKHEEPLSTPRA